MKIFLTGGSGFVGGHLIEALAAAGHEVLAMARSARAAAAVEGYGAARAVRCSLEDVAAAHLDGAEVVIHAAAAVEEWGPLSRFEAINVQGTARVLRAAQAAGARRLVHLSTNAVLFQTRDMLGLTESDPYPDRWPFAYAQTKAEAEQLVLAADGQDGLETLALRPCFVWGPRDNGVLPAVRQMVAEGRFRWLDRGRAEVSTTHVDNLVAAVRLALEGGRSGQAYFVADADTLSLRAFLTGLAGSVGLSLPERSAPGALVRPAAAVVEGLWLLLGWRSSPPVTRMAAALMSTAMTVQTDRARAELGWAPVTTREDGLRALADAEGR